MFVQKRVAVLGASNKPDRYSYKAVQALKDKGYEPIPIHPTLDMILDIPVKKGLGSVDGVVDTVTVYIGPQGQKDILDSLIALKPRRIIANPGTESELLRDAAARNGIEYLEACTLVLLSTGQF